MAAKVILCAFLTSEMTHEIFWNVGKNKDFKFSSKNRLKHH